jgi:hypothetical protein
MSKYMKCERCALLQKTADSCARCGSASHLIKFEDRQTIATAKAHCGLCGREKLSAYAECSCNVRDYRDVTSVTAGLEIAGTERSWNAGDNCPSCGWKLSSSTHCPNCNSNPRDHVEIPRDEKIWWLFVGFCMIMK